MDKLISVIIPTRNRLSYLVELLEKINNQSLSKELFEVIIVNDDSSDGTQDYLNNFCLRRNDFYHIQVNYHHPGPVRNCGISMAVGKIMAFIDDDCLPDKCWLENILYEMSHNKNIVGVHGKIVCPGHNLLTNQVIRTENIGDYPTGNIAYLSKPVKELGGFDENFIYHNEDTDLAWRLLDYGDIIFSEKCLVFNRPIKTNLRRELRMIKCLIANNRLYLKHSQRYKEFRLRKYWHSYFFNQFIAFPGYLILTSLFKNSKYIKTDPAKYFIRYYYNLVCFVFFVILMPRMIMDYFKLKKLYAK